MCIRDSTTAPIDSGQSGGGLISCEHGKHVLAGMLRGFAAYVNGDEYIKIKNHSVSVASTDIRNFIGEDILGHRKSESN